MGRKVLIDTNICIGYIGGGFPKQILDGSDNIIENEYHLSVINKIELLGFQHLTLHRRRREIYYSAPSLQPLRKTLRPLQ